MKRKLLFLTSSYPFGHGESFISPEISELKNYYDVNILPTYPRGEIKNNFDESVTFLPLIDLRMLLSAISLLARKPILFYQLVKACISSGVIKSLKNLILIPKAIYIFTEYLAKDEQYAFIYCHWLSAPAQLALLLNILSGIEYGISAHRWDIIDNNNFSKKLAGAKFLRVISNGSLSLFNKVILDEFKKKIYVIYMGVDIPHERLVDRKKVKMKCLTVGSLINVKGHRYLIDAFRIIKDRGIDCELILVGCGELEETLAEQVKNCKLDENVNFLGQLDKNELKHLYSDPEINIFCLPSIDLGNGLHEGIPVALMEAMSFGIPCVSTKTGSIRELICNEKYGILVEDKSPEQLSLAITGIFSDPEMSKNISVEASTRVSTYFNASINNKRLVELISG
ncbi:MAG: glycosyltransferase family 4 protein [Turicibacter sp.]